MNKFFKILSLIVTMIIIITSIFQYDAGQSPSWFLFFVGWVGILTYEVERLI